MASLSLKNICKVYPNGFEAVKDFNLEIADKEFIIFVGPSGCGKSTLGRTLVQIYRATEGRICYKGRDISTLTQNDRKEFTREVQMIFQDPYASLNPRMTVGEIIKEPMEIHKILSTSRERGRLTVW